MQENYELVQKGFRILLPIMSGYIGQELNRVYHDEWWEEVLETLGDKGRDLPSRGEYAVLLDSMDVATCLRLIDWKWSDVFRFKLAIDYRTWSKELMGVRNNTAHIGQQDLTNSYAERALDTMALLCEGFNDPDSVEEIRALYRTVRYGSAQGSVSASNTENTTNTKPIKPAEGVMTKSFGKNLPSWRTIMLPHPDVAEGRYKKAEFVANLAEVVNGKAPFEYRDPIEFYARTYVTEGMSGLLVEALKRVSGNGGEPVIQLKTAFGGGKTHSMIALYHAVRSGVSADSIPSLKAVMNKAGLTKLPQANVAILVGTALEPANVKRPANFKGYSINTIWGEMAYQL